MASQPSKPKLSGPVAFLSRPPVRAAVGVLSYVLAALLISWAIDTGSLFDYTLAVLLLLSGTRELVAAGRYYWKGRR